MRNADKFKEIFGIYVTELFAKSDKEFLEWLIADVPDTNVGDLISRQAAIDAIGEEPKYKVSLFRKTYTEGRADQWWRDIGAIHRLPSAEPQRNKGRWKGEGLGDYRCSLCGEVTRCNRTNFCPSCGAEMTGGVSNDT